MDLRIHSTSKFYMFGRPNENVDMFVECVKAQGENLRESYDFLTEFHQPPPGLPRLQSNLPQKDDFDEGGDFLKKG